MIESYDKLKELALREFAALELVATNKEECKRKSTKAFKASIKSHIALLEFDQNKKHFKSTMPEISAVDTIEIDDKIEITKEYTARKKTKVLSAKAQRRVDREVSKYIAAFKESLDGSSFACEHEIVEQRAIYHLAQYNACIESKEPTKSQLFRAFLTWIRTEGNCSRPEAVEIFELFDIPTVYRYEIPYKWEDLQPTSITFRTFDI